MATKVSIPALIQALGGKEDERAFAEQVAVGSHIKIGRHGLIGDHGIESMHREFGEQG